MQRDGVEVMQLFAPPPDGNDQVSLLEEAKMFSYRLPAHVEVLAKFSQSLAVAPMEMVEQLSPARVGQRLENCIHT